MAIRRIQPYSAANLTYSKIAVGGNYNSWISQLEYKPSDTWENQVGENVEMFVKHNEKLIKMFKNK